MDGRKDGLTDGRTNGRTEGQTDGQTDRKQAGKHAQMHARKKKMVLALDTLEQKRLPPAGLNKPRWIRPARLRPAPPRAAWPA